MFKLGTALAARESVQQLFQCCEGELGDEILKSYPNAVSGVCVSGGGGVFLKKYVDLIFCLKIFPIC